LIAKSMSSQLERHLSGEGYAAGSGSVSRVRVGARDRALTPKAGMAAVTGFGYEAQAILLSVDDPEGMEMTLEILGDSDSVTVVARPALSR